MKSRVGSLKKKKSNKIDKPLTWLTKGEKKTQITKKRGITTNFTVISIKLVTKIYNKGGINVRKYQSYKKVLWIIKYMPTFLIT